MIITTTNNKEIIDNNNSINHNQTCLECNNLDKIKNHLIFLKFHLKESATLYLPSKTLSNFHGHFLHHLHPHKTPNIYQTCAKYVETQLPSYQLLRLRKSLCIQAFSGLVAIPQTLLYNIQIKAFFYSLNPHNIRQEL